MKREMNEQSNNMETNNKTIIQSVIDFIFGHKYYINIVNTRGTTKCEASSFIFRSREEAKAHRNILAQTRTYIHVETVSFRSYREYGK